MMERFDWLILTPGVSDTNFILKPHTPRGCRTDFILKNGVNHQSVMAVIIKPNQKLDL